MDELNGYPHPPPQPGQAIQILIGRVLERSEMSLVRLDRIDARLALGDHTMANLAARLDRLETATAETESEDPSLGDRFDVGMTRLERVLKLLATYAGPTVVFILSLPLVQLGK